MKKLVYLILACSLLWTRNHAATTTDTEPGPKLTIELHDGSRVVGQGSSDVMSFHSATMGDLKLAWVDIRSINSTKDNGSAELVSANGDDYEVRFAATELEVDTSFGKKELPVDQIRSIQVFVTRSKVTGTVPAADKHVTIDLQDGSRVIGKISDDMLSFHSATVGDLKLPWATIRELECDANTSSTRLTATNGDQFAVQVTTPSLNVETVLGKVELPVKLIRSVRVWIGGAAGDHLLGWWKLNEGSGTVVHDSSSSENPQDGTLSDASMWTHTPGQNDAALRFSGGSQSLSLGNILPGAYPEMSIACWVKVSGNGFETVIERGIWNDPDGIGIIVNHGEVDFGHYLTCVASKTTVADDHWHHLVGTMSQGGSGTTYSIYVDGKLDNTTSITTGLAATTKPWVVGSASNVAAPYLGLIKDLRIYDHALSPEDIEEIYGEQAGSELPDPAPAPAPTSPVPSDRSMTTIVK